MDNEAAYQRELATVREKSKRAKEENLLLAGSQQGKDPIIDGVISSYIAHANTGDTRLSLAGVHGRTYSGDAVMLPEFEKSVRSRLSAQQALPKSSPRASGPYLVRTRQAIEERIARRLRVKVKRAVWRAVQLC